MGPLQITGVGTGATSTDTSVAVAIPNDSSGNRARTVLITVEASTYIQPGISATATTSSMIATISAPLLLNVVGLTTISVLELTAGKRVTITPVEY